MIPVRLCIEGIYSYRERAEIDFKRLCDARLFGIFGPVGSGKSTILEAITFALYGETERMNSREGRSYNMMNLKSSRLWIDFEFQAGEAGTERYRFTVELRRNSKDFSNVGTPKRLAFKWDGGDWIPLPETKAESIIGISYDNFIKTVIIPQGRFQDFLGMSTTDRTRMLKELFDLQRFDLASPTKRLLEATNSAMENIRGRMGEQAEVRQEDIDALVEQKQQISTQLVDLQNAIATTDSALRMQEQAKSLIEEINQLSQWIEEKTAESSSVDAREQHLNRYVDADKQLRDLLEAEKKLDNEASVAKGKIASFQADLSFAKPDLELAESSFAAAKEAVQQKDTLASTTQAMESMSEIRKLEAEKQHYSDRIAKGRETVSQQKAEVDKARNAASELEEKLQQQQSTLPDLLALMDLQQWHTRKATLDDQAAKAESTWGEAKNLVTEAESALKTLAPDGLDALENERKMASAHVQASRERLDQLRTHQRLVEFANQLQDGQPCPLCGALEHPTPLSETGNEQAFGEELAKLKTNEMLLEGISEQIRKYLSMADRLKDRNIQLLNAENTWNGLSNQLSELKSKHKSPEKADWTAEETQKAVENAKKLSEELDKTRNQLELLRKNHQNQEAELQKFEHAIQTLESRLGECQAVLNATSNKVDLTLYESYRAQPDSFFPEEAHRIKTKIASIQQSFIESEARFHLLLDKVRGLETELRLAHQLSESIHKQATENTEKLAQKLAGLGFESKAEVQALLEYKLDIERERRSIEAFRKEMIEKKAALHAKQEALGDKKHDVLLHQQLIMQLSEFQSRLTEKQQETGRIDNQLQQLIAQQLRHAALRKELDALELRHRDLKVMEGLFKADGFVNWVSKVYLKELCHRANLRFQTLTRNRLSLEISDDNAFLVRDMVNDGQTRSVKTLSGGQTFQAALCLALALADNIHARNQHLHNFFFLDEGFGSLDRDSLQVVFDTLKSLQRENRVVGVISHVEEMQQEIDVALRIVLDEERGSLVREI